jgi:hypothetical protein
LVLSELIKKPPNNPVAMGVNLERGPKNEVKFIPAKDKAKSTTENAINSPPSIVAIPIVFSSFTKVSFFSLFYLVCL